MMSQQVCSLGIVNSLIQFSGSLLNGSLKNCFVAFQVKLQPENLMVLLHQAFLCLLQLCRKSSQEFRKHHGGDYCEVQGWDLYARFMIFRPLTMILTCWIFYIQKPLSSTQSLGDFDEDGMASDSEVTVRKKGLQSFSLQKASSLCDLRSKKVFQQPRIPKKISRKVL